MGEAGASKLRFEADSAEQVGGHSVSTEVQTWQNRDISQPPSIVVIWFFRTTCLYPQPWVQICSRIKTGDKDTQMLHTVCITYQSPLEGSRAAPWNSKTQLLCSTTKIKRPQMTHFGSG